MKVIQKPVIKLKVGFRSTSIANRPSAHGKANMGKGQKKIVKW